LDVLPTLAAGSVDAVVTDPPYGVNFRLGRSNNRYGGNTKHHGILIAGDDEPFDPQPFLSFPVVVLCGANNFSDKLPASRGWTFWHKRPGMKPNDFGDGELIWSNQDHTLVYWQHTWNGVLRASQVGDEHYHPTEKPIALFTHLLEKYTQPGDLVFDPYMGSGPCGIAAVLTGRHYVGVELDPGYFAIAQRRIADAQAQMTLPLFAQEPAP
jgi:DNA modification methylase